MFTQRVHKRYTYMNNCMELIEYISSSLKQIGRRSASVLLVTVPKGMSPRKNKHGTLAGVAFA